MENEKREYFEVESQQVKVVENDELGRYLVASEDIEELSVVIRERPTLFGPADDDQDIHLGEIPMCLGCCVRLTPDILFACSLCGWPVCSERCQYTVIHTENECKLFSSKKVAFPPPHTWPVINKSITTLRCLLLKKKDVEAWENVIQALHPHTEIRYRKSYCRKGDEMLMDNMEYFLGQLDDEMKKDIIHISGVISVNAFSSTNFHCKYEDAETITQCLYPTASLLANSCVPNCTWKVGPPPNCMITIRSAVPIKKGEAVVIAYSPRDILTGTLPRQVSNEEVAHFICCCSRCKDPTELGTYLSGIKCFTCMNESPSNHDGYLLPLNPLDPDSEWKCNFDNCENRMTVNEAVFQVYKIQEAFGEIKSVQAGTEKSKGLIPDLELLLKSGLRFLHTNHYILMDIRMHIVKIQMHRLHELNPTLVDNLVGYTKALLQVINVLAPGYSQIRGLIQRFLAKQLLHQLNSDSNDSQVESESDN